MSLVIPDVTGFILELDTPTFFARTFLGVLSTLRKLLGQLHCSHISPPHTQKKVKLQFYVIMFTFAKRRMKEDCEVMRTIFWDITPCCLVDVCLVYSLTLKMEAARFSETSVNFYQTTRGIKLKDLPVLH
jgi:hypothetical protein